MPDTKPTEPLDLSIFDNLDAPAEQLPAVAPTPQPPATQPSTALDPRLAAEPEPARLVEIANLSPQDLAAAQASAQKVDFRNTNSLLSHGEGVLAGIAAGLAPIADRRAAGRCRRGRPHRRERASTA